MKSIHPGVYYKISIKKPYKINTKKVGSSFMDEYCFSYIMGRISFIKK
jgi:hypothetical protein